MLGKKFTENIKIDLKNGEVLPGWLSKRDKKIYGLDMLVRNRIIQHFNILMFTYHGEGQFEIYIFDSSDVEKNVEKNINIDGKYHLVF